MARNWPHCCTLPDGRTTVGYSLLSRGGYYRVRFNGPGGKKEVSTGCDTKSDAHTEAAKIVLKAYAPVAADPRAVGWDAALAEVGRTSPDLRPATLLAYKKAVKALRATLVDEKPAGPGAVTPELAQRFARLFAAGEFRRGKASDAASRKRSPVTTSYYLRSLSALWGQFRELGYVGDNPWRDVRRPQTEKKRKPVPTEEDVEAFFAWVRGRYPEWGRLHCLLELKALSGCRTLDIVQLRSSQLRDGRIVWDASQTKTKEGRAVLLPADLFAQLRELAGPAYLWEGFLEDIRAFRPSKNRLPEAFDPKTVYWVLSNIFREYSDAHPGRPRLTPHALRRRAITLTVMGTGGNVDAAANAIGVHAQTARTYYLDAQRAFNADEVFKQMADVLRPGKVKPQ